MKNFSQYLKYPSDLITFAIIFVAVSAYGLYRGKESLVSLLISLYLGKIVYASSTFLNSLLFFKENSNQIFFSKLIIFAVIVFGINFVISKIIGVNFSLSKVRNWIEIGVLALAVSASAVVIAFNTLGLSVAFTPHILSISILTSASALFWTLIGSLVILFFTAR